MINVFLCDDIAEIRDLVRAGLAPEPDLAVVGEAESVPEALDGIQRERPDAVLLDLAMPGTSGVDGLRLIHERTSEVAVVILSGFAAGHMERFTAELGADGYVEKGEPFEVIAETLRAAVARRRSAVAVPPRARVEGAGPAAG